MYYTDRMFVGHIERHDKETGLYTVSFMEDRNNPSLWIDDAILVRGYKGIQEKNVLGSPVFCAIVKNRCYILGVFGREVECDHLSFDLKNDVRLVVLGNGDIKVRKGDEDKYFDLATYSNERGVYDLNINDLCINILGGSNDGFIVANQDPMTASFSYKIDMGASLIALDERLTIVHDKYVSQILVDGELRKLEILHSSRRAVANPLFATGPKSGITISSNEIEIETNLPASSCKITISAIEGVKIDAGVLPVSISGLNVTVTGGTLKISGTATPTMDGPFNCLTNCLFTGAPHSGSTVVGT